MVYGSSYNYGQHSACHWQRGTAMKNGKPPLDGIRVLDLGRHQAGPRCAQVLARLGAEVIKVERIEGEETRDHGPFAKGQSAYFVQYNSSKKSLAINLRHQEAKQIISDLVKISDVFIQNFRPGTIEKMGFGHSVLKKLNPRIIMERGRNIDDEVVWGSTRELVEQVVQARSTATAVDCDNLRVSTDFHNLPYAGLPTRTSLERTRKGSNPLYVRWAEAMLAL
mgnify:CR=1 FL=1